MTLRADSDTRSSQLTRVSDTPDAGIQPTRLLPAVGLTTPSQRPDLRATKSTAGDKLGPYIHATTFKTIVGDVKFGESGEWAQPRMLAAQFQHVKGNDIEQFRGTDKVVVVSPAEYKSGELLSFEDARR